MTPKILRESNPDASGGGTAVADNPADAKRAASRKVEIDEAKSQARKEELGRVREIQAAGVAAGKMYADGPKDAQRFIDEGKSVDEFRAYVMTEKLDAKPIANATASEIGMSEKEKRQYSIVRAMNVLSNKRPLDGIEREASDAVAKRTGQETGGFLIPTDIVRSPLVADGASRTEQLLERLAELMATRALVANQPSAGGNLIQTDVMGQSLIELLRNRQVLTKLGARTISGLQGNVAIPRQTGAATAFWISENTANAASQQTIGQLMLTPHRLGAYTEYSKTLIAQSSIDVEAFCRLDLMTVLAIERDRAGLLGTGNAGQPLGIANTPGVDASVTFGATATWAKIVAFETAIASANADVGSLGFCTSPSAVGKWKTNPRVAGYPIFLMLDDGSANGYPVTKTNQLSAANQAIFGNWGDMIIADWEGMDVVVDPYTLAPNGSVRVTIQTLCDIGIRHGASFSVSTDSAAQ